MSNFRADLYADNIKGEPVLSYVGNSLHLGWLHERTGLNAGYTSENDVSQKLFTADSFGSLLVRTQSSNTNPVSTPTVFSLLVLGFMGLLFNHRRITFR